MPINTTPKKKKSVSETGDMKVLGEYRRLIDFCLAEPRYKSSNSHLDLTKMNGQYDSGMAAVELIPVQAAPNKVAINERSIAYDGAIKTYRRSRNILKSVGASSEFVADADTAARKIFGTRKKDKTVDNPETSENEAAKSNSASQQSYDNILGQMLNYNALVAAEPLYVLNEPELNPSGLASVTDDLQIKNNTVSTTFVPLSNARADRDTQLYLDEHCIINNALACKNYVKGAFGEDSVLYKQIKGLKFNRPFRKRVS